MATEQSLAIHHLHRESGLSWDELGKLFGGTRSHVHFWVAGGSMSSANGATLAELTAILPTLEGSTPEERRRSLLRGEAGGMSIFDSFRQRYSSGPDDINRPVEPRVREDR